MKFGQIIFLELPNGVQKDRPGFFPLSFYKKIGES